MSGRVEQKNIKKALSAKKNTSRAVPPVAPSGAPVGAEDQPDVLGDEAVGQGHGVRLQRPEHRLGVSPWDPRILWALILLPTSFMAKIDRKKLEHFREVSRDFGR